SSPRRSTRFGNCRRSDFSSTKSTKRHEGARDRSLHPHRNMPRPTFAMSVERKSRLLTVGAWRFALARRKTPVVDGGEAEARARQAHSSLALRSHSGENAVW